MNYRELFIDKDDILLIRKELVRVLGDLNEAVILNQLNYWIEINKKADKNFYDDRYWVFNTYQTWKETDFDFWSTDTIRRTLTRLENKGIVLTANYNKLKIDKTKWYTIDYEKLQNLIDEYEKNQNAIKEIADCGHDIANCTDGNGSISKAIPEKTSKNTNRDIKNPLSVERAVSESEQQASDKQKSKAADRKKEANALFEQLWYLYPLKKGKASVSDTQKLKLLEVGYEELERAISRYVKYVDSVDYLHYKNGSTFFNSGYIDYLDINYVEYSNNKNNISTSKPNQSDNNLQLKTSEYKQGSYKSKLDRAKQKAAEAYGEEYKEEFWIGMEDGEIEAYLGILGVFLDEV